MGIKSLNLSNALFSKVRQRILALLYGQPQRSFHTNEIIRLTRSGTGAVQRELGKLAAAGLITMESIGKIKSPHTSNFILSSRMDTKTPSK